MRVARPHCAGAEIELGLRRRIRPRVDPGVDDRLRYVALIGRMPVAPVALRSGDAIRASDPHHAARGHAVRGSDRQIAQGSRRWTLFSHKVPTGWQPRPLPRGKGWRGWKNLRPGKRASGAERRTGRRQP